MVKHKVPVEKEGWLGPMGCLLAMVFPAMFLVFVLFHRSGTCISFQYTRLIIGTVITVSSFCAVVLSAFGLRKSPREAAIIGLTVGTAEVWLLCYHFLTR
jgi:hypothetical protein